MPTSRQILDLLNRDELAHLVKRSGINLGGNAKGHMLDRLEEQGPGLAELLTGVTRIRLAELCGKLGVMEGPKDKAAFVARLVAVASTEAEPAPPASSPPPAPAGPVGAQLAFFDAVPQSPRSAKISPRKSAAAVKQIVESAHSTSPVRVPEPSGPPSSGRPVALAELGPHLWEAANILRGSPVDRTDWKSYILPLLFFKRVCDVWDEEHAAMVARYGSDFPDEHRFQIPEDCHWRDVRETTQSVGTALQNAMRGLETANQKHLYGVFGDAQWSNKERLPDELLKDLIEHFSALSLGHRRVSSDVMGDAYEYLIKKFADATNKKAGEFYTPRSVVRLMVDILDPKEGETVYDPACGTGGMLLAAVAHVSDAGGDPRTFFGKLYAQEKNLTTASVARMNLFLHGIEDFQVERGDTLRNPVFTDAATGGLAMFDVVIANPPFSLEQWGREVWEADPWGRAFAGIPTDSSGDFAWVQHMVMSMADKSGRTAVVLPQGALFRGGVEAAIRRKLLEADLVEAVIGLAPNLFYGTGLPACVLVLRRKKPAMRKKKVLFLDASTLFRKGRAQNFLEGEHAREILDWFQSYEDLQYRTRVVTLAEIENAGWTLQMSRYVLPPAGGDIPPLPDAVAAFKDALAHCHVAEDRLSKIMGEGGWPE
jgi:type I restriction enzyme M protein